MRQSREYIINEDTLTLLMYGKIYQENPKKNEVAVVLYSSWRGGRSMLLFKEIIIDREQNC